MEKRKTGNVSFDFLKVKEENKAGNEKNVHQLKEKMMDRFSIVRPLAHPCQWDCLLGKDPSNGISVRITKVPTNLAEDTSKQLERKIRFLSGTTDPTVPKVHEQFLIEDRQFIVSQLATGTPILGLDWKKLDRSLVLSRILKNLFRFLSWSSRIGFTHQSIDALHLRYDSKQGFVFLDFPETGFLIQASKDKGQWSNSEQKALWRTYQESTRFIHPALKNKDRRLTPEADEAMSVCYALQFLLAKNVNQVDVDLQNFLETEIKDILNRVSESRWDNLSAISSFWKELEEKVAELCQAKGWSIPVSVDPFVGKDQGRTESKKEVVAKFEESGIKRTVNASKPTNNSKSKSKVLFFSSAAVVASALVCIFGFFLFSISNGQDPDQASNELSGSLKHLKTNGSLGGSSDESSFGKTNENSDLIDLEALDLKSPDDEIQTNDSDRQSFDLDDSEDLPGLNQEELLNDGGLTETHETVEKKGIVDGSINKTKIESDGLFNENDEKSTAKGSDAPANSHAGKNLIELQEKSTNPDSKSEFVTIEDLPEHFSLKELSAQIAKKNPGDLSWKIGKLNKVSAEHFNLEWDVLMATKEQTWTVRDKGATAAANRNWQLIRKDSVSGFQVVADLEAKKDGNLVLNVSKDKIELAKPVAFSTARFSYQGEEILQHQIQFSSAQIVPALVFNKNGLTKSYSAAISPNEFELRTQFFLGNHSPMHIVEKGTPEYRLLKIKKREMVFSTDPEPQVGSILLRTGQLSGKKLQIKGRLEIVTVSGPTKLTKKTVKTLIQTVGGQVDLMKRQLAQVKGKRAKPGQGDRKKALVSEIEGKIQSGESFLQKMIEQNQLVEQAFSVGLGFRIQLVGKNGNITILKTEGLDLANEK